jgi:hypothetical protein
MLRCAERLAALDNGEIIMLLIAADEDDVTRMDGETRLVIQGRDDVRIVSAAIAHGQAGAAAETMRRWPGGFVICQYGGFLVPEEGDLRPLLSVLESPLFLVR